MSPKREAVRSLISSEFTIGTIMARILKVEVSKLGILKISRISIIVSLVGPFR